MLIRVANNLTDTASVMTYLDGQNVAGDFSGIAVKNINGLTANYAIQFGKTGEAEAEIQILGAAAGKSINLVSTPGTLRFDHSIDTPITQIKYNKIIFKRSTTGTAGTASAMTNGTVFITPNLLYTEFDDTSGAATYAYKTQFYNSVTGDASQESDWIVPGGPSFYSLQKIRDRMKNSLYTSGFIKDDAIVTDWINEWCETLTNDALRVNQAYSAGTTSYSFGTAGLGTVTEPLFKYATKIEVTTDGNTWVPTQEIPVNRFSDFDRFSSINPRHYWQGDYIFGILPRGNGGTARMTLGKIHSTLDSDGDELPMFLRSYTRNCIEYLLYKAYSLDQKENFADKHYKRFQEGQARFLADITPRDQTSIKLIDFAEGIGAEDTPDLLIW